MSEDGDRRALERRQRELVAALSGAGRAPVGMDAARVDLVARSLLAKRRRAVEKTWPGVCEALGTQSGELFARYARGHGLPADGPWEDGRRFADWSAREGLLLDAARRRLLIVRASRGWPVRTAQLREARRRVIALRLPGLGVRSIEVPWLGRSVTTGWAPGP